MEPYRNGKTFFRDNPLLKEVRGFAPPKSSCDLSYGQNPLGKGVTGRQIVVEVAEMRVPKEGVLMDSLCNRKGKLCANGHENVSALNHMG